MALIYLSIIKYKKTPETPHLRSYTQIIQALYKLAVELKRWTFLYALIKNQGSPSSQHFMKYCPL
jgi:hypothetical protein